MKTRFVSAALAAILTLGALCSLGAARPAQAGGENTWKWLTYGAGAATVYGIVKRKPTIGLIGAAGTYLAYRKWKSEVNKRHRNQWRRSSWNRTRWTRSRRWR